MEHGKRQAETYDSRQKRRPKRGGAGRQVGFVLLTILLVGICTAGIFAAIFMKYVHTNVTPVVQIKAEDYDMSLSSFIYYQDRKTNEWVEYQTIHGEVNRIPVDIEDMPDALWQAAVAIEDERFFQHDGVDWWRTGGAVVNMFFGMKNTFGGSTLTQQMLKNLTEDNKPYVNRKVREIFRALEFEKNYTKAEILELYLNNIYLGKGCYGVQTAAQFYFGKDASDLTAAECASLIAITNNPSKYGPMYDITITREDGTTVTPRELNKVRQGLILDKMAEVKGPATLEDIDDPDSWKPYLTEQEAAAAKLEELNFLDGGTTAEDIIKEKNGPTKLNNWFVDQVFRDVTADLAEELHISLEEAEKRVYNGGYKIYTTMDLEIQELAESVYADRGNLNNLTSRDGQPIQSGITVMDPYTGNIVAIVGQMGAKEGNLLWSYAADKHQVGSSMKPLTAYAPAIDSGAVTPGTTFDDYPVEAMNGTYWPKNSPNRYRGFTSVASGIQHSINTIAVQTLMAGGVAEAYAFATEKLCLDLEPEDMDRSPLGLGGLHRGLSTIEMAAAFSCFANGGIYNQPRTYTQVLDKDGNVLLENSGKSHVAMKETTAYLMTKMLKSAVDAGTGSRAKFSGMSIAGKTGTTNDNYDRYFVGYTPYYVAAVWTGYKSNARISYSGNPAITMWKKVMQPIHQELANKSFSKPSSGLTTVSLCADSGLLATDACAADVRGSRAVSVEIASGTAPTESCNLHVTRDYCTEGKCLATANCPAGSVSQKAFLNHERVDYGSGVVAEDNAYLLSVAEAAVGAVPPAGGSEGESPLPTGGCPVHTTAPPEITDPDMPVDPDLPVDPSIPQDPSDPNNLPPPDQGGGDSGAGDVSGGTEGDDWWSIIGG